MSEREILQRIANLRKSNKGWIKGIKEIVMMTKEGELIYKNYEEDDLDKEYQK